MWPLLARRSLEPRAEVEARDRLAVPGARVGAPRLGLEQGPDVVDPLDRGLVAAHHALARPAEVGPVDRPHLGADQDVGHAALQALEDRLGDRAGADEDVPATR